MEKMMGNFRNGILHGFFYQIHAQDRRRYSPRVEGALNMDGYYAATFGGHLIWYSGSPHWIRYCRVCMSLWLCIPFEWNIIFLDARFKRMWKYTNNADNKRYEYLCPTCCDDAGTDVTSWTGTIQHATHQSGQSDCFFRTGYVYLWPVWIIWLLLQLI